jgi:hypothetical protein
VPVICVSYVRSMRHAVHEFLIFGMGSILIVLVCLYGLIGGFETAEAFVPLYATGVISGVTALGVYGFALLFRAIRWLADVR